VQGYIIADRRGVDDFAVASSERWATVGAGLLRTATLRQAAEGVSECTVVCGHRDTLKRTMLSDSGLTLREAWWTLPL
jgi:hypothetical protein